MAFTVDTDRIHVASADIGRIAGDIEASVAEMTSRLSSLSSSWTGTAATEWHSVLAEWRTRRPGFAKTSSPSAQAHRPGGHELPADRGRDPGLVRPLRRRLPFVVSSPRVRYAAARRPAAYRIVGLWLESTSIAARVVLVPQVRGRRPDPQTGLRSALAGKENLPRSGGYVLAANHTGVIETAIVPFGCAGG
ncbi:MAG: WXG100 family type VII secretion target [Actinomycetales bacterium]|nr:WXG100 family type VII secretion target [Candidatus Phosphoribacter baldrii]